MTGRAFLLKLADDASPPNYTTLAGMRVYKETHDACGSVIEANGIFLGNIAERTLRHLALSGSRAPMQLSYEGGQILRGEFLVLRLESAGQMNGEKSYTITLSSAILSAHGNWQETLNEVARLEAENARLREALAPFARAEHIIASVEMGRIRCVLTYPEGASQTFALADLKRARAALEPSR